MRQSRSAGLCPAAHSNFTPPSNSMRAPHRPKPLRVADPRSGGKCDDAPHLMPYGPLRYG